MQARSSNSVKSKHCHAVFKLVSDTFTSNVNKVWDVLICTTKLLILNEDKVTWFPFIC